MGDLEKHRELVIKQNNKLESFGKDKSLMNKVFHAPTLKFYNVIDDCIKILTKWNKETSQPKISLLFSLTLIASSFRLFSGDTG